MFRLDSRSGAVSFTSADVAHPFTMSRKRCSFLISASAASWYFRRKSRHRVSVSAERALAFLQLLFQLCFRRLRICRDEFIVDRIEISEPLLYPLERAVDFRCASRPTEGARLPGHADSSRTSGLTLELPCPCHTGYEFVLSRNPTRPINRPNALMNIRVDGELNECERNPGVPGLLSRKREKRYAADEGISGQRGRGSGECARGHVAAKRERLYVCPPTKNFFPGH